jgi:multidrug transporter EmrE-like cation transporter
MPYVFILGTVLLTVYGQLVIKWQVNNLGVAPENPSAKIAYLVGFILNPWVISSYAAAFLASLCWMAAVRQLDLSYAYPFTSLSFVLVMVSSAVLFHESVTLPKIGGLLLIIAGIIIGSRS